jgi:prevent-host-death family protein
MCYFRRVTEVGLREMRQNASELVRRAEAGEQLTITVAGRPAAVLGPVGSRLWLHWSELAAVFDGPTDPSWESDRHVLEDSLVNPWEHR